MSMPMIAVTGADRVFSTLPGVDALQQPRLGLGRPDEDDARRRTVGRCRAPLHQVVEPAQRGVVDRVGEKAVLRCGRRRRVCSVVIFMAVPDDAGERQLSNVCPVAVRCPAILLRRRRQASPGLADDAAGRPGRAVDRRAPGVRRRPRRRRCRAGRELRCRRRPQQPLPAPVDAPVDQRAAEHRPAARHPPGVRAARRAPRLGARGRSTR